MNPDDETIDLESRIATATSRCAVLRISGPLEAYMESFDEVEALEMQLRMRVLRGPPPDD